MAHAPGPWRVVRDRHNVYVRNQRGLIATGSFPQHYDNQDERFEFERGEYEANAHLIAAAPDLLDALQVALLQIKDVADALNRSGHAVTGWHLNGDAEPVSTFFADNDHGAVAIAEAAIAKATRTTP